ncbi:hypothetical protein [uncultured Desulfovibrio sp.]|uniref:hypothetical protein n=1 Tax=uncultured Desulfovibrio sp. TaxID=167968 RepID=UPI00260421B5|nr:hypothetical protein [uncultured Desulfovibrio sp.]
MSENGQNGQRNDGQGQRERFDVFQIRDYRVGREIRTQWTRLGAGWVNRDGSYNIQLHALPLPDPESGLAKLHMRKYVPRDEDTGGRGAVRQSAAPMPEQESGSAYDIVETMPPVDEPPFAYPPDESDQRPGDFSRTRLEDL